jgi:L-threonylcarbamoyladenylate synthase
MRIIDLTERSEESTRDLLRPVALAIKNGDLTILPTMTYYGLCADALNPDAVSRVFRAKGRDPSKPLIILVDSFEMLKPLVEEVPPVARELEWRLGARGLTYVLKASGRLPMELTAGTGTVAARLERNEVVQEVLALVGQPITAPSANREGSPPPRTVDAAVATLRDWVEVAVRWYASTATVPTTLVDLTSGAPRVLRVGTVPAADVASVAGSA